MHVGPGRPKIAQDKNVQFDDELSPYVTVRLAVGAAVAMPIIKDAVATKPSFAPSTAARNHPEL